MRFPSISAQSVEGFKILNPSTLWIYNYNFTKSVGGKYSSRSSAAHIHPQACIHPPVSFIRSPRSSVAHIHPPVSFIRSSRSFAAGIDPKLTFIQGPHSSAAMFSSAYVHPQPTLIRSPHPSQAHVHPQPTFTESPHSSAAYVLIRLRSSAAHIHRKAHIPP